MSLDWLLNHYVHRKLCAASSAKRPRTRVHLCITIFCIALTLLTHGAGRAIAQGQLSVAPDSVDFRSVAIGQSQAVNVTLTNSGTSKVVFSKEELDGVEFNLIGFSLPLTLEPGKETTFTVQFYPRNIGQVTGSIVFESDASNASVYVSLHGEGISFASQESGNNTLDAANANAAPEPASAPVAISNSGIVGSAPVLASSGTTSGVTQNAGIKASNGRTPTTTRISTTKANVASTTSSITLVQHGSTDDGSAVSGPIAVTLDSVGSGHLLTCTLTYGNPGGTSLSVSDNLNGQWSLANTVHFDPASGQTTAQFYLANSKAGTTKITGTPGSAGPWDAMNCQEWSGIATSNPLDQATQQDGTTANPSSSNVTTTSGDELVLGVLQNVQSPTAGSGFTLINNAPQSWLASEYKIQSTAGLTAATWNGTDPAGWTAQVATFRAAGSSAPAGASAPTSVSATPSSAVFSNVPVGTKNTQTVQLSNNASTSAVISAASIQGAGFATSGLTVPATLGAGTTSTFNVTYSPTSTATVGGMLTLSLNGGGSVVIPLLGNAVTATRVLTANPPSISFRNVVIGGTATSTVALSNTGNSSVTINSVTTSGTGFSTSGVTSGAVIASGRSTALAIAFAPNSASTVSGSITISTNASTGSTITIPVTGVGSTTATHSVVLTWDASTSTGVAGYNVYRSTVSGGSYAKIVSSPVVSTTYTDNTAQTGIQYYYVVTTVSTAGVESVYSSQVTVSVP